MRKAGLQGPAFSVGSAANPATRDSTIPTTAIAGFVPADQPKPQAALRSTIIFLICAMALAGLRPLGQTLAQFMMVWQR
jgi:hypothetical protein